MAKKIINTAKFFTDMKQSKSWGTDVRNLVDECQTNLSAFYGVVEDDPAFDKYRSLHADTVENAKGKFMANVIFDIESKILDSMITFYKIENVATLMFDGLHLNNSVEPRVEECAEHIVKTTGCKMILKVKSMQPSQDVLDKVDMNKHGSDFDTWDGLVIKDYDEAEYDTYVDNKGDTKKCIHPLKFEY